MLLVSLLPATAVEPVIDYNMITSDLILFTASQWSFIGGKGCGLTMNIINTRPMSV